MKSWWRDNWDAVLLSLMFVVLVVVFTYSAGGRLGILALVAMLFWMFVIGPD